MASDAAGMKISALAPWFGGKRTLAPAIVAELGPHKSYWDPMCGSMAVLFAKPRCRLETVNDLHGDLINLARVVQHVDLSRQLYERARLVLCADEELSTADGAIRYAQSADSPDVERALAYLIVCWQGRNGTAGIGASQAAKSICVRWTNGGGAPGTRWHAAVRSIAAWHRRLRSVAILRRDAFEVLEKIADEPDAAIYLDPPYLAKSDQYAHDLAPEDHTRLANLVQRFKRARVVVSYYDHPRLSELYPTAWTKRVIEVTKNSSQQTARDKTGATKAREVLLINGPSLARGKQADLFN